ncbi:MAG: enoyl-CoA hydratase [Acidimicrobiales bacterium]
MTQDLILVESQDGVATVTLNRPSARNALSRPLLRQLRETFARLGSDDSVGVVILTGADPAFCAGLDLKELSASSELLDGVEGPDRDGGPAPRDDRPAPQQASASGSPWEPLGKPLIGAVNGAAITGGLELALNCDFLIASERAVFADTHARVGIMPGWGLSVLLPERVGFTMARRMSFTGDFVDARRALECGLVTEVVPHDQLLDRAQALAATIAANHRPAVLELHGSYRRIEAEINGAALDIEADLSRQWRQSGGADEIANRVPGVIARGRTQAATVRS